jgi:ketosteroid isomerase-like protein
MKTLLVLAVAVLSMALLSHGQTNKQETATPGKPPKAEAAPQKLEQEWADAVKRRDIKKINGIQADEYVFTGPGGQIWTKAQALESVNNSDLEIDSFELSDINVRIYGETAVVTLRVVWNGRFRGNDISGPQRMTDVFVKRDGRWQCVASQSTRIAQP